MTEPHAALRAAIAEAWPRAQAHWSRFLLLSAPELGEGLPSVAQIHLGTRQVTLDAVELERHGLQGSLEAILAHEVGHHVRYPGSLAVHARMHMIERQLIPIEGYSLLNTFTDFLINAALGESMSAELVAVYRAFAADNARSWQRDPAFVFYLSAYEELWALPPGHLMGPARPAFEARFPRYRAEAQLLAQNLVPLGPNLYTQLLYFLSIMAHYIVPDSDEPREDGDGFVCRGDEPSPEDWADALFPDAREREAVRRALAEGWIQEADGERLVGEDAMERRIASLPGQSFGEAELVPEVMAAWYRREAERYLVRPPPQPTLGDSMVPTTLRDWEPGEPLNAVDWLATLVERGEQLGAAAPLERIRIAEIEGYDVPMWQPRIEIYLDVSGSMPDPRRTRNAMTLASQILTLGAIRAGGWVRTLLYSHDYVRYWTWCRSELEISRFLMHYIGGGTEFPFDVLEASFVESGACQPIRVIISDHDFVHNHAQAPERQNIFRAAAACGAPLVLLLRAVRLGVEAPFVQAGAQVIRIDEMEDFPKLAAELSRAFFGEGRGRGHGV